MNAKSEAVGPVTIAPAAIWRQIRGYPLRAFGICLFGWTFANMDQALFGYAVPDIMKEFGISVQTMGWVFALSFAISGALLPWLGSLVDHLGRKTMFQAAIVISSLFVTSVGAAPNLIALTILRGLGFAWGSVHAPITFSIVVEESPARYRGILTGAVANGVSARVVLSFARGRADPHVFRLAADVFHWAPEHPVRFCRAAILA